MLCIVLFPFALSFGLTNGFLTEYTPVIKPTSANASSVREHVIHYDANVFDYDLPNKTLTFVLTISGGKYGPIFIATELEEEDDEGYPKNILKALKVGKATIEAQIKDILAKDLKRVTNVSELKEKYWQLRAEIMYIDVGLMEYEKNAKKDELWSSIKLVNIEFASSLSLSPPLALNMMTKVVNICHACAQDVPWKWKLL